MLNFNSLAAGVNSTSGADPIEVYIESVIGSNVTVYTGAKTLKNKPENVGPANYLGNTDYINGVLTPHADPKDTYLINRWDAGYDRIKIYFDVAVYSIEFDWQIFPVTTGEADITVKGDGTTYFYYDNAANKQNGIMGHTAITFNAPVNLIEFIDWTTAPVGIDNLLINYPPPPPNQEVPEPATGLLALLGGLGIAAVRRRQSAAA